MTDNLSVIILNLCFIPFLLVSLILSVRIFKKRKKRGYRVYGYGTALLLSSEILLLLSISLEQNDWIQTLRDSIQYSGFYISFLGILQLYKVIPWRARVTLYGFSVIIFGAGLILDGWESILFALILCLACCNKGKWIPATQVSVVLGLMLASELTQLLKQFLSIDKYFQVDLLGSILNGLTICMFMVIIVERISDVLEKSYQDSVIDMLTGLFNRRYFTGMIARYVERELQVTLVILDLDNFKKLNDSQGHEAGDAALKSIADIIKEEVDSKGFAARFGGEEMVMLITKDIQIAEFCENVRYRIEKESTPQITASIGFSKWVSGVSVSELIKRADEAMYHSKSTGKNKVTGYQ
ncbi:hypothetical protein B1A99_25065 [Cohnella sp. CIP 111063]|uniref:GGDEF domain-containing protein n=1 Tax=unclassified Cohnella TaxID=2636738 RepID=UPI000B8C05ED|nr:MULTISPECIES: GGDEF domain-containing protein [unclassified Cohnella]OXS55053.1 hypothetical protein B1A99_25065 [Cohnella sp. CIP 111063]PRX65187.1 diguanylate cyclase (GGDEF)-like protein [Cohnella sp. SGD-V74]